MKGWKEDGDTLVREVQLHDYDEALDFLEGLSERAVDWSGRRPDAFIRYGLVRLEISNRHNLGITEAERRLATKVSAALEAQAGEEGR
jgi:pterin-4a-carbinolamine dehydratase